MEINGERQIPANREKVWELLNDPAVLKQCIPGCKELEETEEGGFAATVQLKIGPVKATFEGAVTLTDKNYPESYRINGEGKGGIAGFAKGGANVQLEENSDGTLLKYDVDAQVGGKIAQLGARLIKSTSNKLAGQFFDNFVEIASGDANIA